MWATLALERSASSRRSAEALDETAGWSAAGRSRRVGGGRAVRPRLAHSRRAAPVRILRRLQPGPRLKCPSQCCHTARISTAQTACLGLAPLRGPGSTRALALCQERQTRHHPHERLHVADLGLREGGAGLGVDCSGSAAGRRWSTSGTRNISRSNVNASAIFCVCTGLRNMWASGFARNGRIVTTGQVNTFARPGSAGKLPVASTSPENARSPPSSTSLRTASANFRAARWSLKASFRAMSS